jgi:hypothetical protein
VVVDLSLVKKYILHHLWLGLAMIVEAILLFYIKNYTWGGIYLGFGVFFFVDDLLAETVDISIMKRLPKGMQEENRLKLLGLILFLIQLAWFLYLFLKT